MRFLRGLLCVLSVSIYFLPSSLPTLFGRRSVAYIYALWCMSLRFVVFSSYKSFCRIACKRSVNSRVRSWCKIHRDEDATHKVWSMNTSTLALTFDLHFGHMFCGCVFCLADGSPSFGPKHVSVFIYIYCYTFYICVDRSVWFLLNFLDRCHSHLHAPFTIHRNIQNEQNLCLLSDIVWFNLCTYRNKFICCFNSERGFKNCELFPMQNCNYNYKNSMLHIWIHFEQA